MEMEDSVFNSLLKCTKALPVALGYRDLLTRLHSERVQGLSAQIGEYFGMSNNEMNVLNIAALFHDIGKIGIPDHILLKPSQLDDAEWEIMKQHSEIGEKIMGATELEGSQQVALVIRHHHEHYNGLGYPDKLSGENIPVCSRIISIADSYDAMAVSRPYRRARMHLEIMTELHEETGSKHDPELMRGFCEVIESSKFKAAKI
ncbi:MAG: HD domain-containing protein [Polaromonas sp.]|uniref:HD-GYP domain-containing protein n=1 Tax=Polaromonas sp. TaxID=1869339 RepID=UPI002731175F|nr:HD domain-containing phosphohydrolase [Polaromonas sp.]MDP2449498.1 HD domain-containing protein [Polaromonas sp.]MDP3246570.1 HD domain-containing protein [Polaromonas sp.]MDP3755468.1 HD domain-containing protein [Polaromonas sp.]